MEWTIFKELEARERYRSGATMIEIAKEDIKLYKSFDGTNTKAISPFKGYTWGRLRKGRVLKSEFSMADGICRPGIHASETLRDARLSGSHSMVAWLVIIPKGTLYYKSNIDEAKIMYSGDAESPVYRAMSVKLVRRME